MSMVECQRLGEALLPVRPRHDERTSDPGAADLRDADSNKRKRILVMSIVNASERRCSRSGRGTTSAHPDRERRTSGAPTAANPIDLKAESGRETSKCDFFIVILQKNKTSKWNAR